MEQIIAYRSKDGRNFDTAKECLVHEATVDAKIDLNEAYGPALVSGRAEAIVIALLGEPDVAYLALGKIIDARDGKVAPKVTGRHHRRLPTAHRLETMLNILKLDGSTALSSLVKKSGGGGYEKAMELIQQDARFRLTTTTNRFKQKMQIVSLIPE